MNETVTNTMFRPKPSQQEAKADVTTRIARGILDAEVAQREAKTERLRLARLAKEEAAQSTEAKPAKKRAKTK